MPIWKGIILGIIQGAAEFLPISSSGHLVIVKEILGVDLENGGVFMLRDETGLDRILNRMRMNLIEHQKYS